ncbi:MAG: paraquat-inducible protein A [Acetobacteraceae bacterium]
MTQLIACPDCGAIQQLPPSPPQGRLECWRCGHVLERAAGRSLDRALACATATLLLLFPANLLTLATVHAAGLTASTRLGSGIFTAWAQRWPLVAIVLGLEGVILPFLRFGLLAAVLAALRFGRGGGWTGVAFRYSEKLDLWAMADVFLIGGGIGYGRVVSETPVTIGPGGWCFIAAALMTMVTRASLERRAVWRRIKAPPSHAGPGAIACTSCDLVLPPTSEGHRCPRCAAPLHRRRPNSAKECAALVIAGWALTPIAYGFPMSEFWKVGMVHPHTIIDGIRLLFQHGFALFGVIIFLVSLIFPFTKLICFTWFLLSIHERSTYRLRTKTWLYRFIDEGGRWSTLDPFTVVIFAPMIQFSSLAHIDIMGGSPAFLATVVISLIAGRVLDPRLMWDASSTTAPVACAEAAPAERASA